MMENGEITCETVILSMMEAMGADTSHGKIALIMLQTGTHSLRWW